MKESPLRSEETGMFPQTILFSMLGDEGFCFELLLT